MPTVLVSPNFDRGYMSDRPRDQLPPGFAYRMKDWLPTFGAPLRRRGGWTRSTTNLNIVSPVANIAGVAWVPFPDDPHLMIVGSNGKVFLDKTFNGSGGTFVAQPSFGAITHSPFWSRDLNGMILLQGLGLAAANPQKYTSAGGGTYAVANLGGTPPQASVGANWTDYVLLANGYISGTRYANRIWVSGVGTPEVWTPGTAFWDMPDEVVRIQPLRVGILVLGYTDTWLLVGDTPPPGGNWSQQDVFHGTGCMDGRSLVTYREFAIWANNTGVYKSDGYTLTDLTEAGGVKKRWRELVGTFDFKAGWRCSAGVYAGHYVITILDNNGTLVTCQVCDIERGIWYEFTNVPASMFASRPSGPGTATVDGSEELFFAHWSQPYACRLSPAWMAQAASDADGVPVLPQLETPFWKPGGSGRKVFRRGYVTYDLRDGGSVPHLQFEATTSPDDNPTYVVVDSLAATTKQSRSSFALAQRDLGVALRLKQLAASTSTRLAELELNLNVLEGMR